MAVPEGRLVRQRGVEPAPRRGALRGFANLQRKEYGLWWNTRRWLVHLLLWPLLFNGLALVAAFTQAREPNFTAFEIAQMVTTLFCVALGHATAFGAVVVTQGAIVGEKQRGTAAWILSKPVGRPAFVLAKLAAYGVSYAGLAVLIPSAIFYGQSVLLWGSGPDPLRFAASVLLIVLHALCYLALTLMLGTLAGARGVVAGSALGAVLGGMLAQERLKGLAQVMPWELPDIAALLATGGQLPARVAIPIVATMLWAGVFVVVAVWRFTRDEF